MGDISGGTCIGCTDRHVGCHGECSRYLEWKRDQQTLKTKVYQKRHADTFYSRYVRDRNSKHMREI